MPLTFVVESIYYIGMRAKIENSSRLFGASCLARQKGFTLIEVMVVVAIIGILSTIAYASLQGAIHRERIRGNGGAVISFLNRVHAETRKQNAAMSVRFYADSIVAYTGSTCDASNRFASEALLYSARIQSQTTPSGSASSWVDQAWSTCQSFVPNIAHHSIANKGFVELALTNAPDFRAIIYKAPSVYHLQWAYSIDGGDSWTAQ